MKLIKILIILLIIAVGGFFYVKKLSGTKEDFLQPSRELLERIKNNLEDKPSVSNLLGACDKPLSYSIGNVDSRFGITPEDFQKTIAEAEKIWENEMGMNLFEYAPEGNVNPHTKEPSVLPTDGNSDNFGVGVKINLVFDERQKISDESEKLNQELDQLNANASSLDKKYDYLKNSYNKKVAEYEAAVKKYEKKLKNYNEEVNEWNSKGGAPEDEYKKLQDEKEELDDNYKNLDKKRKEVNKLAKEINALAEKESKIVSDYNQKVNTYKSKYGTAREFEKGVYNGQEINIYQFNEMSDLRLVLAHEMGHAKGIEHVQAPQALMYYLMAEQNMDSPKLAAEDIAAMKSVCGL